MTASAMPSLTVLIPTYARTALLAEALESVRRQTYTGTLRALVVNDCARQTLHCSLPWVTIENRVDRFPSIAQKRNHLMSQVHTEFLTWLDDDDLLLPWHCAQMDPVKHATRPRSFFHQGVEGSWSWWGTTGIVMMVRTSFARDVGFVPKMHAGEDSAFWNEIVSRLGWDRIAQPPGLGYVYRHGRQMHLSQSAEGEKREWSPKPFWQDAENRMDRGEEPTGEVWIKPAWKEEYGEQVRKAFPRDVPQ